MHAFSQTLPLPRNRRKCAEIDDKYAQWAELCALLVYNWIHRRPEENINSFINIAVLV